LRESGLSKRPFSSATLITAGTAKKVIKNETVAALNKRLGMQKGFGRCK
jgi:hypothetical protein